MELQQLLAAYKWWEPEDVQWLMNTPVPINGYPLSTHSGHLEELYWETMVSTMMVAIKHLAHLRQHEDYKALRAHLYNHEVMLLDPQYSFRNVGNNWTGKVECMLAGCTFLGCVDDEEFRAGLDVDRFDESLRRRLTLEENDVRSDDASEDYDEEDHRYNATIIQCGYFPKLLRPNADGVWLLKKAYDFKLLNLVVSILRFHTNHNQRPCVWRDDDVLENDTLRLDNMVELPTCLLRHKTMSRFLRLTQKINPIYVGESKISIDLPQLLATLCRRGMITVIVNPPKALQAKGKFRIRADE